MKIKNYKLKIKNWGYPICMLSTLYFVLITSISYSQETEIHKSRSSATIGGIKYSLHTVEKGQTLFAIARFYGREVKDILIENPTAIDGIKPGQVLRIPIEKTIVLTTPDTSNYILHKVEQGQTLYSLSKQYGTSIEKVKALNPQLSEGLKVGQTLKMPSYKPTQPTAKKTESEPAKVSPIISGNSPELTNTVT
ncbi:MAG: LysM peptidoglycan-binding domain-containing protein, partial [Bacteroidetes bacterium]|nr:LysM peptidoglycan-binding domain-containing protein [Bacteroidota bacterium]